MFRDSLGKNVDPKVSFLADGGQPESHLYVTFDTIAIPNASDAQFESRARDLARFAVRHYERVSDLDSITVATGESWQPGVWRVHHSRTFSIAALRQPSASDASTASPH